MTTLKNIQVSKSWGIRPTDSAIYIGCAWMVEPGEPYDLVQFSINEINGYYWRTSICVPEGTSDEDVEKIVKEYVSAISDEEIREYKKFLDWGNKYGWD